LLADQLAFAVAVGGKPDAPGRAERFLDRLELARLVPAPRGLGPEEPLGAQQDRHPSLPVGVHLLRLAQRDQMPLGRQNRAIAVPERRPDVPGLATLLGDDDVARHVAASCSAPLAERMRMTEAVGHAADAAQGAVEAAMTRLTAAKGSPNSWA